MDYKGFVAHLLLSLVQVYNKLHIPFSRTFQPIK